MAHTHGVFDSDAYFIIDPKTREIKNQTSEKTKIMQYDHNSEVFGFSMPRLIEKHDMLKCDKVEIHFNNIEAASKKENKSIYEVKDMQINPDDEEKIVFTWMISEDATQLVGTLNFLILFGCTVNGKTVYRWHTDINSEMLISSGMNNEEAVTEPFPDILAQWKEEIFGNAENAVANINLAEQNALASVKKEGAAQITDIQAEGTTQVENVRVTAEAIEASREQIHLNNTLKASAIVGSAEGEVILLDDGAEQPFVDFQLFGKSEQATTKGHQLFDASRLIAKTIGGASVTNNGDGSFTLSGSNTLTDVFAHSIGYTHEETIKLLKVGPLTCDFGDTSYPNMYIQLITDGNIIATPTNREKTIGTAEVTQSFLDNETSYLRVGFYGTVGENIVTGTMKPMLYQDGDGTWEAFTGGIPSPNPEYPQEINSVENPEFDVYGKNLLNVDGMTNGMLVKNSDGSYTFTKISSDGRMSKTVPIFIPANTPFVFSADFIEVTTANERLYPIWTGENGGRYWTSIPTDKGNIKLNFAETIVSLQFYMQEAEVDGSHITFKDMMIELGENETDYEPYKGQTLSLPYTLHGIPVSSGGNYTDADGQQWICDEVEFERGVMVQRIVKHELNSGITMTAWNGTDGEIGIIIRGLSYDNTTRVEPQAFCTHFMPDVNGSIEKGQIGFRLLGDYQYIYLLHTEGIATTVDEWKTFFDSQIENGTPVTILAVADEPIETTLSEVEIEAFKALVANYPYTTILNDCRANMMVKYGIDTKTYIDKKFEELKNTLTT